MNTKIPSFEIQIAKSTTKNQYEWHKGLFGEGWGGGGAGAPGVLVPRVLPLVSPLATAKELLATAIKSSWPLPNGLLKANHYIQTDAVTVHLSLRFVKNFLETFWFQSV